ncbi:shikimate kinase I [Acidihalobacter yilgarnensis]|uniref:Shikimate kinase n=1 Tax=Acidihalobacter yilgarnensis TaxID=2819280 RepID=A0A1D8IK12_9GAMM|nr:shikimate kinase AroK [Acidihalobacter yilgarnensis]AOU96764.1 shikimate kinase I [Acidihalobacter yilgarnensis]
MTERRNVFLIGPMGAGKTTIGRRLAPALGLDFYDSDELIISRTGVDIATIFDIEGESGFRERESRVLDELTQLDGVVIATGGGVVLSVENRNLLKARGRVVYLTVPLELQLRRTRRDNQRPLLQTSNPRERLETLQREREPLYQSIADIVIDTAANDSRRLARELIEQLSNTD